VGERVGAGPDDRSCVGGELKLSSWLGAGEIGWLVDASVGPFEGEPVGDRDGLIVGSCVVGSLGAFVGEPVGERDGVIVGSCVVGSLGAFVGEPVGDRDGLIVGSCVVGSLGAFVGGSVLSIMSHVSSPVIEKGLLPGRDIKSSNKNSTSGGSNAIQIS